MKNIVLELKNISKLYRLGEYGSGTLSEDLNIFWNNLKEKIRKSSNRGCK